MDGGFGTNARSSIIKSIQRGSIAVASGGTTGDKTNTATITSVNTSKSEVRTLGEHNTHPTVFSSARVELTNATTITAYAYSSLNTAATITVGFEVTEFF